MWRKIGLVGRRNKLEKFVELLGFPNVYQNFDFLNPQLQGVNGEIVQPRGKWREQHFKNQNPLVLELACGGGEYTLGLSEMYPDKNFIGIDVKGNRIWKGARKALAANRTNAAFLRTRIEQVHLFFGPGEVDEIWITFPDPFLKKSKANRRLTNHNFLALYEQIVKPGALLHLKTDSPELFEFTHEVLGQQNKWKLEKSIQDIYSADLILPELQLKTHYEKMHLIAGKKITYIQVKLV